ncbi:MAG: RNA polymerase sigma factor [Vicinamibacterales bacterium]
MTDADLVRRFVESRDESAFRALYARHAPAVYGTIRRLADTFADADDAFQEAWLRASAGMASFRGASAFRTWLTGIALNCLRERRRNGRHDWHEGPPDASAAEPADHRRLDVAEVLAAMSAPFREVLVLHDVEGHTHEEIADLLGIEPGTSKSRLSRARSDFRRRWRASPGPAPEEGSDV